MCLFDSVTREDATAQDAVNPHRVMDYASGGTIGSRNSLLGAGKSGFPPEVRVAMASAEGYLARRSIG